jgi:hypothetical protein
MALREAALPSSPSELARAIDALVEERRSVSLWHLRPDWFPRTDDERRSVLQELQKRGDVDTYQRAATLLECLSRHSSAGSAAS